MKAIEQYFPMVRFIILVWSLLMKTTDQNLKLKKKLKT